MPYKLFLKNLQNLKLSSVANYRWRFIGYLLLAPFLYFLLMTFDLRVLTCDLRLLALEYGADLFVGQHFYSIRTNVYRHAVGVPMGTNYAPLVAKLILFCYEDFMMSLSDDKQADTINAFNTISRYLGAILNINNVYFDNMVIQIYPSELKLIKANTSDTKTSFLDLHLSISNDMFLPKFTINVTILILKLSIYHF